MTERALSRRVAQLAQPIGLRNRIFGRASGFGGFRRLENLGGLQQLDSLFARRNPFLAPGHRGSHPSSKTESCLLDLSLLPQRITPRWIDHPQESKSTWRVRSLRSWSAHFSFPHWAEEGSQWEPLLRLSKLRTILFKKDRTSQFEPLVMAVLFLCTECVFVSEFLSQIPRRNIIVMCECTWMSVNQRTSNRCIHIKNTGISRF